MGKNFIFRNSRAPLGKKHSVDMFIVPMRDLMCILGSTYYGLTLLSWTDILHTHIYLIYIKYPVFWNFQLCCSRNRQAGGSPSKEINSKKSCPVSPAALHQPSIDDAPTIVSTSHCQSSTYNWASFHPGKLSSLPIYCWCTYLWKMKPSAISKICSRTYYLLVRSVGGYTIILPSANLKIWNQFF